MGIILGGGLTVVAIWIWQTFLGNISVTAVLGAIGIIGAVFAYGELRKRRAVFRAKAEKADEQERKRYQCYYQLLAAWMVLRNKGQTLSEYFVDHNYKTVVVYGLDRLGICLLEELRRANIHVAYAIDPDVDHFSYLGLKVQSPEHSIEPADVIVVTPFLEYEKIVESLKDRTASKFVSLEDVVHSI
jgi:hypothetical protein